MTRADILRVGVFIIYLFFFFLQNSIPSEIVRYFMREVNKKMEVREKGRFYD